MSSDDKPRVSFGGNATPKSKATYGKRCDKVLLYADLIQRRRNVGLDTPIFRVDFTEGHTLYSLEQELNAVIAHKK